MDFFTPIVDSPYYFGKIAVANSLSDIYAMGGKPIIALNILCIPANLPHDVVEKILKGGLEKAKEAGVFILGGHSIQDKEPKYGLSVLGIGNPKEIIKNNGAKIGDLLYLTKPIGTGILTTALKRKKLNEEDIKEAIEGMENLNSIASELALEFNANGLTDVTGFGLLGHLSEMLDASKGLEIYFKDIPFYNGALKWAFECIFPGGAYSNQKFYEKSVEFKGNFEDFERISLFSPETSGGLLIAISPEKEKEIEEKAKKLNQPLWKIGRFVKEKGIKVIK